MPPSTDVDAYLATLPDARRAVMEQLRQAIRSAAPEATETIAYNMPAFRSHGGQFLASFDAYENHCSLFPASDEVVQALGEELTPYLAGKGTIRFPASRHVPLEIVAKVARIGFEENAANGRR